MSASMVDVARVLIVDDEPDILLMLRVSLEADGYETAMAADGETALQRLDESDFDLMLLDVMMPVMDGWGVLENLQRHPRPPKVIVVSAKSSDKDVARALGAGAIDYLTKPFSPRQLAELVSHILGLSEDELQSHREALLGRAGRSRS
jgi:DNA-binding response OmpR family regulator